VKGDALDEARNGVAHSSIVAACGLADPAQLQAAWLLQ
jgi:hypothetical protein